MQFLTADDFSGMLILWRVCVDVDGSMLSLPEPSLHMDRPATIAEASRKDLVTLYTSAYDAENTKAVRNRFIE